MRFVAFTTEKMSCLGVFLPFQSFLMPFISWKKRHVKNLEAIYYQKNAIWNYWPNRSFSQKERFVYYLKTPRERWRNIMWDQKREIYSIYDEAAMKRNYIEKNMKFNRISGSILTRNFEPKIVAYHCGALNFLKPVTSLPKNVSKIQMNR